MAYNALIAPLTNVRPHPNADRLQLATVEGSTIIVGLDQSEGDVGIFFPPDGQLSHEYVEANNLYRRNPDGTKGGGFFDLNRRVRAQPFRGVRSEGYWAPLSTLEFAGGTGLLDVGDRLSEFNWIPICQKYYTPATLRAMRSGQQKKRKQNDMFHEHFDTPQWRFYKATVLPSDRLILTEKVHGTSGRYGRVLEPVPQRWWEKLLRRPVRKEWTYLMGTRRVIVDYADTPGFYGSDTFRYEAVEPLNGKLHKGEVVYFEIVGWVSEDTPIMPPVNTTKVDLPHVTEVWGDNMAYTYGCMRGTRNIYVYRISMVNEDGIETDLTWQQVKTRCMELGVQHVPEYTTVKAADIDLDSYMDDLSFGPSVVGNHMREGICIRIESGQRTPAIYKHKSYEFGVLEGYIKQDDNYVDLEETS